MSLNYLVLKAVDTSGRTRAYYFDGRSSSFQWSDTETSGPAYELVADRIIEPIRAEDYPSLAAIWDNPEDDEAFGG